MKKQMPLIISMAWRNIQRNLRRTILSGGAIFLVSVFICLMMSLEYGSMDDMKYNIVHHEMGAVRIRNPRYTENERITPLNFFIPDTKLVEQQAGQTEGVTYTRARIRTPIAVYKNEETEAANLVAVNFPDKYYFSDKDNILLEGSLDFMNESAEENKRKVLVTDKFAQSFNLHANDKFTFIARTANGGTNGYTVTVAAIMHFSDGDLNGKFVFMNLDAASKILRMKGNATEIMLFCKNWDDKNYVENLAQKISGIPELSGLEIVPWTKGTTWYAMIEMSDFMYFIYALIFFILASTVIFNSTMMSVMERKKEIGALLSLGMTPKSVRGMFLIETAFISGISAFAGCLLGGIIVGILHKTGINLAGFGYEMMGGFNMKLMLYPSLSFGRYVEFFLTGFLTAFIACLIPSRMALKVQPAEALRAEN